MKCLKSAILALGLLGVSSVALADDVHISWVPHVMPDVTVPVATYIAISGGSVTTVINDSDEPHTYHMSTEIMSSCGLTEKRRGLWQMDFTVQPHTTWSEEHDPAGYVKCNMEGQKEVTISMLLTEHGLERFYKTYTGWFHVKHF